MRRTACLVKRRAGARPAPSCRSSGGRLCSCHSWGRGIAPPPLETLSSCRASGVLATCAGGSFPFIPAERPGDLPCPHRQIAISPRRRRPAERHRLLSAKPLSFPRSAAARPPEQAPRRTPARPKPPRQVQPQGFTDLQVGASTHGAVTPGGVEAGTADPAAWEARGARAPARWRPPPPLVCCCFGGGGWGRVMG